jgi:protein SCO1/2
MSVARPSFSAVLNRFLAEHEHEPRARTTKVIQAKIVTSLQAFLALVTIILLTASARGHDETAAQKNKGAERREVRIAIEDFTLVDQRARPFNFKSLGGKVVIVAFAYTTCPDVCPLITAAMRQVQDALKSEERASVYFLTITTDPEIDTPNVMASYAGRYEVDHANWAFLSGDEGGLKDVWKNFGVGVRRKARGLIDHTTLTAVIDRSGTMRIAYVGTAPDPKAILKDTRRLLRESKPN